MIYLDDILIYSENKTEYKLYIKTVLQQLKDTNLQADLKKIKFHMKWIKYLDFIITTESIEMDYDKVSAVCDWSVSISVQRVQFFLEFCNYYRCFIKEYNQLVKPLNQLIWKDIVFNFNCNPVCFNVFLKLKKALLSVSILWHYNPDLRTKLKTNSSDEVVAGILSQLYKNSFWHLVVYYLKIILPAESNYSIQNKELLAIVSCMKK